MAHASGIVMAGLVSLVIAVERFVNAMLVDGIAPYAAMPFVVAAISGTVGIVLLVASVISAWARSDRPDVGGRLQDVWLSED